jgi:hypothetical protein
VRAVGGVEELDAGLPDPHTGRPIDDLIAQLAPVVVGKRKTIAGLPVRIDQRRHPVDQIGRRPRLRRKACRVQGRPHAVPDQQQVVEVREILGVARNRYTDHQPEIPEQIILRGQQRRSAAGEVVLDPASRHGAVDVAVPPGTTQIRKLRDILVRPAQSGVARERGTDVGTGEEMELDAGARRRGGIEGGQHARHLLVGAGLGPHFQAEAERIAIDEDLAVFEPGTIRQPLREGRRIIAGKGGCSLRARQEVRCLGSSEHGFEVGDQGAKHDSVLRGDGLGAG